MKTRHVATLALIITSAGCLFATSPAFAQGYETISYQGYLSLDGKPAAGAEYTLTFRLYDQPAGGSVLWVETHSGVVVSDGVFDVPLGSVERLSGMTFDQPLWISVAVGNADAAEMSPRMPLGHVPYAFHALSVGNDAIRAGENVTITRSGKSLIVSAAGGGSEETPGAWKLTGNAGIDPETQFLGTLDAQPLELRVNGEAALRLLPPANALRGPNVVAGHKRNLAMEGVSGATVGGGGDDIGAIPMLNRVYDDFGTIGGGRGNVAGSQNQDPDNAPDATVSGGNRNVATGPHSSVGGGLLNEAWGNNATIAGGTGNKAGNSAAIGGGVGNEAIGGTSTIAGGAENDAEAIYSVVPGGRRNRAAGVASFAAGNRAAAIHDGAFVWADYQDQSTFSSTEPNQFLIQAGGGFGINTNSLKSGVIGTMSRPAQAPAYELELRTVGLITTGNYGGIAFTQSETGATELASIQVLYHNNGLPDLAFNLRQTGTNQGSPRMVFLNDGQVRFPYAATRVGIGVNNPVEKLEVAGNVKANNVTVSSDSRLKRDITPIADAIRMIASLRGVEYRWRSDEFPERGFEDGLQYGFIAQDVKSALPDLVREGSDGMLSVEYVQVVPMLVEAIKQQQAQIAELTDQLRALVDGAGASFSANSR